MVKGTVLVVPKVDNESGRNWQSMRDWETQVWPATPIPMKFGPKVGFGPFLQPSGPKNPLTQASEGDVRNRLQLGKWQVASGKWHLFCPP